MRKNTIREGIDDATSQSDTRAINAQWNTWSFTQVRTCKTCSTQWKPTQETHVPFGSLYWTWDARLRYLHWAEEGDECRSQRKWTHVWTLFLCQNAVLHSLEVRQDLVDAITTAVRNENRPRGFDIPFRCESIRVSAMDLRRSTNSRCRRHGQIGGDADWSQRCHLSRLCSHQLLYTHKRKTMSSKQHNNTSDFWLCRFCTVKTPGARAHALFSSVVSLQSEAIPTSISKQPLEYWQCFQRPRPVLTSENICQNQEITTRWLPETWACLATWHKSPPFPTACAKIQSAHVRGHFWLAGMYTHLESDSLKHLRIKTTKH